MRWVLTALLVTFVSCDRKEERALKPIQVTPDVEFQVELISMESVSGDKKVDVDLAVQDVSVDAVVSQEDRQDVVDDLKSIASELDIDPVVSAEAPPLREEDKKAEPMVRAKASRKKVSSQEDQIQKMLVESKKQVDKLEQLTPRELNKKIRDYKRNGYPPFVVQQLSLEPPTDPEPDK